MRATLCGLPVPAIVPSAAQMSGYLAREGPRADGAHRVAHQVDAAVVDLVVLAHPRQHLHHVLLAERRLRREARVAAGSRSRRSRRTR